jgi:hypothetical protein
MKWKVTSKSVHEKNILVTKEMFEPKHTEKQEARNVPALRCGGIPCSHSAEPQPNKVTEVHIYFCRLTAFRLPELKPNNELLLILRSVTRHSAKPPVEPTPTVKP